MWETRYPERSSYPHEYFNFMTIRSPWAKLWDIANRNKADYSVSPAHDIEDDVDEDPATPPAVLETVVTGITDEFVASETVETEEGDVTVAEVPG